MTPSNATTKSPSAAAEHSKLTTVTPLSRLHRWCWRLTVCVTGLWFVCLTSLAVWEFWPVQLDREAFLNADLIVSGYVDPDGKYVLKRGRIWPFKEVENPEEDLIAVSNLVCFIPPRGEFLLPLTKFKSSDGSIPFHGDFEITGVNAGEYGEYTMLWYPFLRRNAIVPLTPDTLRQLRELRPDAFELKNVDPLEWVREAARNAAEQQPAENPQE